MSTDSEDGRVTKTIVFFDICGYSEKSLAEQLRSVKCIEDYIRMSHLGTNPIVEGGDSYAVGFDSATRAIEFAIDISSKINSDHDFKIRMGVCTGEVVVRETLTNNKNMNGIGIDYAARLASVGLPGQIFVSDICFNSIENRSDLNKYRSGHATYNVKHGVNLEVINLHGRKDEKTFGISELPMKHRKDQAGVAIVVGEKRETPPKWIGDLFQFAPSVDDLCHLAMYDWGASDVILRCDKIMYIRNNDVVGKRNLIAIGSPQVNIASYMLNKSALFKFTYNGNNIESINEAIGAISEYERDDENFIRWRENNETMVEHKVRVGSISDSIFHGNKVFAVDESFSYGLVTFAKHPSVEGGRLFSVMIAGINLEATLAITKDLLEIDFSERPYGGVIKIVRPSLKRRGVFESPHESKLARNYWETPAYTLETIRNKCPNFDNIVGDATVTMKSIQTMLKKK